MTFSRKVFVGFYGLILVVCSVTSLLVVVAAKSRLTQEYLLRYNSLGAILAASFQNMERQGDQVSFNALQTLKEIEEKDGMPDDAALDVLAQKLGVTSFYIIDRDGKSYRLKNSPPTFLISAKTTDYFFPVNHLWSGRRLSQATLLTDPASLRRSPLTH